MVLGVVGFTLVERVTTQPQSSVIVTSNPNARTETYFVRHDFESFIKISTDGKKTITHIDSRRFVWLMIVAVGGGGLAAFRWPLARLAVPNSKIKNAATPNA